MASKLDTSTSHHFGSAERWVALEDPLIDQIHLWCWFWCIGYPV